MEALLEFKNITKYFPGVQALKDVSFTLEKGEVHVIVGENGAGKSTLMKILSGAYTSDSGKIIMEGKEIHKNSPRISRSLGICMIYQELNLIPELSIADNIFIGNEIKSGLFINKKEQIKRSKDILEDMGIKINPRTLVKNLSIATRQMIEISKALSKNAKVLIFDEPTSSLTESEIRELFRIIRLLKQKNVGMFYISHRLEELYEIGDRVSVMRDGTHILTDNIKSISIDKIIENIAGRKIENLYPRVKKVSGDVLLKIEDLTGEKFSNVNIDVKSGEIVGLAGLVGSGRTETARAAFGIDKYISGNVYINNIKLPRRNPKKSVELGFCLLPEDRKLEGLALPLNIRENSVISSLKALNPFFIINKLKEKITVKEYMDKLYVTTATMNKLVKFLSGGTQQKIVIAKWLISKSKVFIFDEPTRGIDVGAKTGIYELMDFLVSEGAAVLMISSDLPEVLGMSDRIYVMSGGNIVGEFNKEEADQNKILKLAFSNM